MKLFEVLDHDIYHYGADIDTDKLRPLTFFTDKSGAESFQNFITTNSKLHAIKNTIRHPASVDDVVSAAREVGIYDERIQPVDYITTTYYGEKSLAVARLLQRQGYDGVIMPDVDGNGRKITSYIPFTGL